MVPIRVALDGFMSYREPAELNFDGAPLWMLCGPNGAGKSSVFDAITFALYGLHRGGKNEARELINHSRDSMTVEFDVSLGAQVFRVRRSLTRKGRSGLEAFRIDGPQPLAIAETSLKSNFDAWIDQILGMDDRTFTTSVLLQQGRSDALLSADARERHKILSQIVDLSHYENLHKTVAERVRFLKTEAEVLNNQLEGMERVDESEIERLGREAQTARERVQVLAGELQTLAVAQNVCAQYHNKARELEATRQQFAHAQQLLGQAEQIESDHARFVELKLALPHLSRVVKLNADLIRCAQILTQTERDAQSWQTRLETAQTQETTAREATENAQTEREKWQQKREVAREVQVHLTSAVCELDDLERARAVLEKLDASLAKFPTDLEAQLADLRARETQLSTWKNALPWLRQIVEARSEWAQMKESNNTLRAQSDALQSQIESQNAPLLSLQEKLQDAQSQTQSAQEAFTQTRTLLGEERKRLVKLDEVDGLAECETCGHELTPEHIEFERTRRENAVQVLASTCSTQKAQIAQCQEDAAQIQARLQQLQSSVSSLETQKRECDAELNALKNNARGLQNSLARAIENLPDEFAAHFDAGEKVSEHFKNPFPHANEIRRLEDETRHFATVSRNRELLERDERERADFLSQRVAPQQKFAEIEAKYSLDEANKLRGDFESAKAQVGLSDARLRDIERALKEANQNLNVATSATQSARDGLDGTRQILSRETARREQLEAALTDAQSSLEGDWRAIAAQAQQEDVERWENERETLAQSAQRLRDLNAARNDHAGLIAREAALQSDLEAMPVAARGDLGSIEAQVAHAKTQQAHWENVESECKSEQQNLQARAQARLELDAQHRRATREANTHSTLATLLGPQRLQRFLLQQAEDAIVNNANYWLDRVSGGTLQIELKREDPNTQSEKLPKALELMARNTLTSEQALPVYLLSGSQRFRVAVSLALGIGQFAGGESGGDTDATGNLRRIESVIIDEGFGSLDAAGRTEMIDELHNLKSVLKRVILVSHQEEFSDAFPNRYQIQIENGSSTAQIVTTT